ncbi:hypothetical protein VOLCADRAFT_98693 [Volvox carteri f. nagariensis]|uniref:Uncharacterized protein n=1 Tax=Volvox carteri f. nagariensis TaxID=3068 RepID=D8UG13_VOLCA|nr:uncharacterized protein VOLCADRAFT_98693 [Volvox carteri f. nagariensis]EFJ41372.1 hypothetical protein VOLCADRAFT_98693 [Volvox carteri f. nagariensis]|eukprot:XP_002957602.1 hypothetical protein VOLCADRAFT_98693 [Volvox carteri f. nagariensis]
MEVPEGPWTPPARPGRTGDVAAAAAAAALPPALPPPPRTHCQEAALQPPGAVVEHRDDTGGGGGCSSRSSVIWGDSSSRPSSNPGGAGAAVLPTATATEAADRVAGGGGSLAAPSTPLATLRRWAAEQMVVVVRLAHLPSRSGITGAATAIPPAISTAEDASEMPVAAATVAAAPAGPPGAAAAAGGGPWATSAAAAGDAVAGRTPRRRVGDVLGEAWWRRRASEELQLPAATLRAIKAAGVPCRDAVLARVRLVGAPPSQPRQQPLAVDIRGGSDARRAALAAAAGAPSVRRQGATAGGQWRALPGRGGGGAAGAAAAAVAAQSGDWYDEVYELMYALIEEEREREAAAEAAGAGGSQEFREGSIRYDISSSVGGVGGVGGDEWPPEPFERRSSGRSEGGGSTGHTVRRLELQLLPSPPPPPPSPPPLGRGKSMDLRAPAGPAEALGLAAAGGCASGHTRGVRDIAADSDAGLLASAGWDNRLIVWELQDCSIRHFIHIPNVMGGYGYIRFVAVGGGKVAVAQAGGKLYSSSRHPALFSRQLLLLFSPLLHLLLLFYGLDLLLFFRSCFSLGGEVHALMVYDAESGDVYDVIMEDRWGAGRPDQQRFPDSLSMQYVRAIKITPNGRWLILATSAPPADRYHVYDLQVRAFSTSLVHPAASAFRLPLDEAQPIFCPLQGGLLVTAQRGPMAMTAAPATAVAATATGATRGAQRQQQAGGSSSFHSTTCSTAATSLPPLLVWDLALGKRVAELQATEHPAAAAATAATAAAANTAIATAPPSPLSFSPTYHRLSAALRTASVRQFLNMAASADGTRLYLLDSAHQFWILDLAASQALVAVMTSSTPAVHPHDITDTGNCIGGGGSSSTCTTTAAMAAPLPLPFVPKSSKLARRQQHVMQLLTCNGEPCKRTAAAAAAAVGSQIASMPYVYDWPYGQGGSPGKSRLEWLVAATSRVDEAPHEVLYGICTDAPVGGGSHQSGAWFWSDDAHWMVMHPEVDGEVPGNRVNNGGEGTAQKEEEEVEVGVGEGVEDVCNTAGVPCGLAGTSSGAGSGPPANAAFRLGSGVLRGMGLDLESNPLWVWREVRRVGG